MNIRILINFLLVASLAIININGMERKRRSCDDLDVSTKKIKLDPDFAAKLAKIKKEKEAINLDFIQMPGDLQKKVAEYLKNDWYLYHIFIIDKHVEKVVFSLDNNFLLFGNKDYFRIVNIPAKFFTKIEFATFETLNNLVTTHEKKAVFNDYFLDYNYIEIDSSYEGINPLGDDQTGIYSFCFDRTYFSKNRIINGIFSRSLNEKYLAFACVNFFKIWDISRRRNYVTEKDCIITYNINQNKEKRDELDNSKHRITHLVFSKCSDYLAIIGWYDCVPDKCEGKCICYIYDLKAKSIIDLTNIIHIKDRITSVAFSHNSKYLAVGVDKRTYVFKNRQDGFE